VAFTETDPCFPAWALIFRDWNNDGKPSLFVTALDVKHSRCSVMRAPGLLVWIPKAGIGFPV